MDFVEICNVCTRKVIIKVLRGCLILIRFDVVIVISVLASLFLEHSVFTGNSVCIHYCVNAELGEVCGVMVKWLCHQTPDREAVCYSFDSRPITVT